MRVALALMLALALTAPAAASRRRTCVTVHMDGVGTALICAPPRSR